jgi:dTDP-glucose pyrophosphorylase
MKNWRDTVISPDTSLGEAIFKINESGLQVALALLPDGRLFGILTDGNIRRAILKGLDLQTPVKQIMNSQPTSTPVSTSREEMLAIIRRTTFHHLPLVNDDGIVVGLTTIDELIGPAELPNWVILMAGGLGTRLKPYTDDCPKPMLKVAGKPILETILESFVKQGFKRFFLSVNYKAEIIQNYFGNGEKWGIQIDYLHESKQLGTAGALSLIDEKPIDPVIVMNGDLLTRTNFESLLKFHLSHNAIATMAVREYDYQIPFGVVHLNHSKINSIEEKPFHRHFVNAGIYVLAPEALSSIPNGDYFNMTDLFSKLISLKQPTVAYPLSEYWLDIGRLEELERAHKDWE